MKRRWDSPQYLKMLIHLAEFHLSVFKWKYSKREQQIDRWNSRIEEIEREGFYKKTEIGFKIKKNENKT